MRLRQCYIAGLQNQCLLARGAKCESRSKACGAARCGMYDTEYFKKNIGPMSPIRAIITNNQLNYGCIVCILLQFMILYADTTVVLTAPRDCGSACSTTSLEGRTMDRECSTIQLALARRDL